MNLLKELNKLSEGTWALNHQKIPVMVKELQAFKKKLYGIAGDDVLFDHIDDAIDRLEELRKAGVTAEIADRKK